MTAIRKALIVVDVQNDFCPGGSLAVPCGDEVITPLNRLMAHFASKDLPVALSRDWHPRETNHFAEFGGPWPVHCVGGTHGAEFHPNLSITEGAIIFSKGTKIDEDAYSAFQGVTEQQFGDYEGSFAVKLPLHNFLNRSGVGEVYIGGLATDYCVKATVLDALRLGYKVYLVTDACRAVNITPEDGENAIREMVSAGAILVTSEEVMNEHTD